MNDDIACLFVKGSSTRLDPGGALESGERIAQATFAIRFLRPPTRLESTTPRE